MDFFFPAAESMNMSKYKPRPIVVFDDTQLPWAEFASISEAARYMQLSTHTVVARALSGEPHNGLTWAFKYDSDAERMRQAKIHETTQHMMKKAAKMAAQKRAETAEASRAILAAFPMSRQSQPSWISATSSAVPGAEQNTGPNHNPTNA